MDMDMDIEEQLALGYFGAVGAICALRDDD
jgi:hypothetical protein